MTAKTARHTVEHLTSADLARHAALEQLEAAYQAMGLAAEQMRGDKGYHAFKGKADALGEAVAALREMAYDIGAAIGAVTELHDTAAAAENYE